MTLLERFFGLLPQMQGPSPLALQGPSPAASLAEPTGGPTRFDSTFNPLTGLGGASDKGAVGRPNPWVVPLNDTELRALYGSNGIARRIVDILPTRATRKGWTVPEIGAEDKRLKTWDRVTEAMIWARLYGGSALMLVTEDDVPPGYQMDPAAWLAQPLDLERVGRVIALQVFDPNEAAPMIWDRDVRSPTYRRPILWTVSADGFNATVHGSRIVHFRGARRPPSETAGGFMRSNRMPDDSCLQAIWDEIRRLSETMAGGATLAQELRESVLKVADLGARGTGDEAATLAQRISLMGRVKSMLGIILIGAGDEYTNRSNPPTGWSELSDGAKSMLAAVSGLPETVLFGATPGGLNTDGDSGHESFRQLVSDYQETNRPELERIYQVIYAAQDGPTKGKAPEGWALTFAPLDEPSEMSKAEVREIVARTDLTYINCGVYAPSDVQRGRFGPDGWAVDLPAFEAPEEVDEDAMEALRAEMEAAPVAGGAPGAPGAEAIADTALNGAQVKSLLEILQAVALNQIPRDAAIAIVMRAFQVDEPEADRMLGSAGKGFVPAPASKPGKVPPGLAGAGKLEDEPEDEPPVRVDAADGVCVLVPAADPGLLEAVEAAIGQRLTVHGTPHVTVLYVGRGLDEAGIAEVAEAVHEGVEGMTPEVLGRGVLRAFPMGPDGVPVVVELEDAWPLAGLHERLLRSTAHVVTARQHKRYRAHLTIGYAPAPLSVEAASALLGVDASRVRVPVTEVVVMAGSEVVARDVVG